MKWANNLLAQQNIVCYDNTGTISVLNEDLQTMQTYSTFLEQPLGSQVFLTRDNLLIYNYKNSLAVIDIEAKTAFTLDIEHCDRSIVAIDTMGKNCVIISLGLHIRVYNIDNRNAILARRFDFTDYFSCIVIDENRFMAATNSQVLIYNKNASEPIDTLELPPFDNNNDKDFYMTSLSHFIATKYLLTVKDHVCVVDVDTNKVEVIQEINEAHLGTLITCDEYLIIGENTTNITVYDAFHNLSAHQLMLSYSFLQPLNNGRILVWVFETVQIRCIRTGDLLQTINYPNNMYGFQTIFFGNDFKALSWTRNWLGYNYGCYYDSKTNSYNDWNLHQRVYQLKTLPKSNWRKSQFITNLRASKWYVDAVVLFT